MNHTLALNGFQAQVGNPTMVSSAFGQMFHKAASRAKWRRFLALFNGRSTQLQSLQLRSHNRSNQIPTVEDIDLDDIIGSEGRCQDFDNQFWPLQKHNRDRWINIALARYKEQTLPPIQLVHATNGYFVRDGHHRISVARALGQATIEAEVV